VRHDKRNGGALNPAAGMVPAAGEKRALRPDQDGRSILQVVSVVVWSAGTLVISTRP
jgi:hypothetical protein